MIKRIQKYLSLLLLALTATNAVAQRFTDNLDRGLVAVKKNSGGVFLSWRQLAEEYYGVTYNVYRGSTRIASNLDRTNMSDTGGTATSTYTVRAVVNGVEQAPCKETSAGLWKISGDSRNGYAAYLDLDLETVRDRNGSDVTHHYWPNDMIFADLDGDGELEFIVKRVNNWETNYGNCRGAGAELYPTSNTTEFVVFEAYDVNWQTGATKRMWWIDCGPNVVSLNSTELNILAFDWDEDGRAEVLLRGADDMRLHHADGTMEVIGVEGANYRGDFVSHTDQQYAWTRSGPEYLIYMDGTTGAAYETGKGKNWIDYPLKRLEDGEDTGNLTIDLTKAWNPSRGYGHVSSKYYMGAPYLDGRKASIFLARGIYTRHKFMALDVDPKTHKLTPRWEWHSTATGTTPGSNWFGNGFHNYVIADVDEDGRDEIVYGHIVIDDNGQGLHATNYGHGDAMHVNDFDPYRQGLEIFTCIEDEPAWGAAYRSGLTGEVYWKFTATGDDGRCLAGNFCDDYPGSIGQSSASPLISLAANKKGVEIDGDQNLLSANIGGAVGKKLNYRIYWDGDLLSEVGEGTGSNAAGRTFTVFESVKGGNGYRIFTSDATALTNNDSKNNPCLTGDILGDWREEIVLRLNTGTTTEGGFNFTRGDKVRIYSTIAESDYTLPTLWHDKQYRQAMGTQMQVYNLPPHLSYFLGMMEGITVAPPPITNRERTEVANGGTITTGMNGSHVMMAETGDMTVTVADGASPQVFTDNAPFWVQGNNPSKSGPTDMVAPTTTYYTHTLKGAAFTGATQVAKQGFGVLELPAVDQEYTGDTKVWEGTLRFNGTMKSSPVWLNRHTALSGNGTYLAGITADYGARLIPGGDKTKGTMTATDVTLNFGARVVVDLYSDETCDQLNVSGTLTIGTKTGDVWTQYGPEHLKPVLQIVPHDVATNSTYDLGLVQNVRGSIDDLTVEGLGGYEYKLEYKESDHHLYLILGTGVSPQCKPATFAETGPTDGLQLTDEGILLPVVDILPTQFDYGETKVVPTLTATYTDLQGNVSDVNILKTLYSEDYEAATDANDWTTNTSWVKLSFVQSDAQYGNYVEIHQNGGGGARSAYKKFYASSDFYGECNSYTIEFDACYRTTYDRDSNTTDNELVIFCEGAKLPAANAQFTDVPNLFKLYGGKQRSTTYTVAANGKTCSLTDEAWYHYKIDVDKKNKTVAYKISNNNSVVAADSYVTTVSNLNAQGIGVALGRYNSYAHIDNLKIYARAYTFTRPGTLTVTSAYEGCIPARAEFKADSVGVQIGSLKYATLGCQYPLDLSGVTAYVVTEVGSGTTAALTLSEVSSAPGKTGLLLYGEPGVYRLPIKAGDAVDNNWLVAQWDATTHYYATANDYALANKTADVGGYGLGFYPCKVGVEVPVGKSYLTLPDGSRSYQFLGLPGGAVRVVSPWVVAAPAATVYDLSGRRVGSRPLRPGVYISGGRKVIVR